jgi:hypothetical protein
MAALLHDETAVLESVAGVRLLLEVRLRPFGLARGRAAFGPRLLDELRVRSQDIGTLDVGQGRHYGIRQIDEETNRLGRVLSKCPTTRS